MSTPSVYFGLGGIFRNRLINESDVVSCWPLAEIAAESAAQDILFGRNPGIWTSAGGCQRGVAIELPEGMIGPVFDGTGYILVADDGVNGYRMPGDDGAPRTLSCADGDIDIVFLVKTSTSNNGFVIRKYDGSNGYRVDITGGAVRFRLGVAGSQLFSESRGSVADGALHLVQCLYNSVDGEIKIYIDGVQSGSTGTCTPTDPDYVAADVLIGSGFIGMLAYVTVSRNGNQEISADLQACRAWTDVTDDVLDNAELVDGIPGTTLRDVMAGAGTFQCSMDNGGAVVGRYTVGHVNARAGFDLGIPVKVVEEGGLISFRGRLLSADPEPGVDRGQSVLCLAADWFELAARQEITQIPLMVDARSDEAFAALIDQADYPPVAVSLPAGAETFPSVFDHVSGPMLTEMAHVVTSEGGASYIRPDSTTGGVVTFESRLLRLMHTVDATFDETMRELTVELGVAKVVNVIRYTVTPRLDGPSDTAYLYRQERRLFIDSGSTVTVESKYQDPDQSRSAIGGVDKQPFTAGTDYVFTANEDGTGTVLTSNLRVVSRLGGSGFRAVFTNPSGAPSGWVYVQVRGRVRYTDTPITAEEPNRDSVRKHGHRPFEFAYKYLDSLDTARSLAQLPLGVFATPRALPNSMTVFPAGDAALDAAVLPRAVGDLIAIGEPMSSLVTTGSLFYIQNRRRVYRAPDLVEDTYGLFPAVQSADAPFGIYDDPNSYFDQCLMGI